MDQHNRHYKIICFDPFPTHSTYFQFFTTSKILYNYKLSKLLGWSLCPSTLIMTYFNSKQL
ncbi:hypothetical protein HanRHA438_Chr03g0115381 [Helianthus annuus]|nr:hypothetical protein HanRHA438_Chr03g0115381 [Helianthus annuus]